METYLHISKQSSESEESQLVSKEFTSFVRQLAFDVDVMDYSPNPPYIEERPVPNGGKVNRLN